MRSEIDRNWWREVRCRPRMLNNREASSSSEESMQDESNNFLSVPGSRKRRFSKVEGRKSSKKSLMSPPEARRSRKSAYSPSQRIAGGGVSKELLERILEKSKDFEAEDFSAGSLPSESDTSSDQSSDMSRRASKIALKGA
jgi:hypothetical protein